MTAASLSQPSSLYTTQVPAGAAGARQSLKIMRRIVQAYYKQPAIIMLAHQIINQAGIRARDYPAQAEAVFEWVRSNIAFVRDPVNMDMFTTPDAILQNGAGDCDDLAILYATFMQALGHPSGFLAIQQPGFTTYNHVLAITLIGNAWRCADPSDSTHPFGWCPPSVASMVQHI